MQRGIWTRSLHLVLLCGAFVAVACSDPNATGPLADAAKQTGSGGGSDTSTSPPPTSNGPVASVRVTPQQLTVAVGATVFVSAVALDANGVRVLTQPATWRSGDANVVAVSDTGALYGKAIGTTKVYATIDGHTDSATVTVTTALPSQPPSPSPAVASFDLDAVVLGIVPGGADTTKTEAVPGATVKLARIGTVSGDTLSQAIDAGSAVADANGAVSFKGLAGGSYSVIITPPSGSPYQPVTTGFGPPRSSTVKLQFKLFRNTP